MGYAKKKSHPIEKILKCIAIVRTIVYNNIAKKTLKGVFAMATKSANLYARIEPDLKEQAEGILSSLGISTSNAITMFYKQIVLQRGLPFDVKLPAKQPVDVSTLTEQELNAELEKGYADIAHGRVKAAEDVFADLRKNYSL